MKEAPEEAANCEHVNVLEVDATPEHVVYVCRDCDWISRYWEKKIA